MRWAAAGLALLLASVAGVQGVAEAPEGPHPVWPTQRLPLEPGVAPESHSGRAISADGDLAAVVGVGDCNRWSPVLLSVAWSCSASAPSRVRLYARGDDWRLVDALTVSCTGYYSQGTPAVSFRFFTDIPPSMDLEDGVVAVAQPCQGDLLGELLGKVGAVRIVSFDATGATQDTTLGSVDPFQPADLLRPETFGTHVQVDGGAVYVASVGGEGPTGEEEPDLIIPYRRDGGSWRPGTPYEVDVDWDKTSVRTPFLVDDGWLALHDGDGWRFSRLLDGGRMLPGPVIPGPSGPAALEDGRFVVAVGGAVQVHRNRGSDWLREATLPVSPTGEGPASAASLDVSGDHLVVGRPGDHQHGFGNYREYTSAGTATLWGWIDGGWTPTHEHRRHVGSGLGEAVALAGPDVLLGAPDGDGGRHGPETSSGYQGETYVHDLPDPPVSGFWVERASDLSRTPVTLHSTAWDPDDDIAWQGWDVGDDGTVDAEGRRVTTAFPRAGLVPVRLTVVDEAGLRDSTVHHLEVRNRPPVADFGPLDNVVFRMAERALHDRSGDPDGDVVAWHWSTSDGRTHDGPEPTFVFDRLGPVEVTLTVTDNLDATAARTKTVLVVNHPPVVEITHTPVGLTGEPVTLTVSVHDPDGVVTRWHWLDDDAPTGPDAAVWTRTWDTPGPKTVAAAAWDDLGQKTTGRVLLHVGNRPPVAEFRLPENVPTGTFVTPEDRSRDPDGHVRSWTWDRGDGRDPVTDPLPRLSWDAPGRYVVRLVVEDDHGGRSAPHEVTVTVDNRPPAAVIASFWDAGAGEHVVTDASSDPDGEVVAWEWRVDGTPAEAVDGVLRIPGAAVRVDLRVEDDHGSVDEATTYLSPPIADAEPDEGGPSPPADDTPDDETGADGPDPTGAGDDGADATAWAARDATPWMLWLLVAAATCVALLARGLFWRKDDVA